MGWQRDNVSRGKGKQSLSYELCTWIVLCTKVVQNKRRRMMKRMTRMGLAAEQIVPIKTGHPERLSRASGAHCSRGFIAPLSN